MSVEHRLASICLFLVIALCCLPQVFFIAISAAALARRNLFTVEHPSRKLENDIIDMWKVSVLLTFLATWRAQEYDTTVLAWWYIWWGVTACQSWI